MTAEGPEIAAPATRDPRPGGRTSFGLMMILAGVTAVAPFSLQIFLPALPAIQADFAVGAGTAQLALSLSILANAFATLSYGPLSDRFGRRPVLLGGLVAFVLGSVACALAPTIGVLIAARIVQSVGGAAGMVLGRAIVRDLYGRERAASVIAYLTMAMVVAPMLAPTIGAIVIDTASWRATFYLVAALGALLTWQVALGLAETRMPGPLGTGWTGLLAGAGGLLRSPPFLAYVLQSTFGIAVFFSFISGAPYFMIDVLGRSVTEYGFYFILISLGFMAGNLVAARLSPRTGLDRMILCGSMLSTAAAWLALALLLGWTWQPLALFGPMMLAAFANGLTIPNAQAGAVSVEPTLAGTASGLAGFAQMFMAALVSQAVGMLQNGTPYPMAGFMAACAALSLAGFVGPRRVAAS